MSEIALGISSVFGGAGSEWFQPSSRKTARLLRLANNSYPPAGPDDGGVTVMFQVPGSLSAPDFEGLKAGRLSRAAKGLVVEIAVPERVGNPDFFIGSALVEAVGYAAGVFERKKMEVDLSRAAEIAQSVATDLGVGPSDPALRDEP